MQLRVFAPFALEWADPEPAAPIPSGSMSFMAAWNDASVRITARANETWRGKQQVKPLKKSDVLPVMYDSKVIGRR